MISPEEQFHIIQSGAAQIVPEKALMDKLKRGKPLNIKLGVDPTAPISILAMLSVAASCASSRIWVTGYPYHWRRTRPYRRPFRP